MVGESYDVIVIGAGSAGCALAARLSENPVNRVLLLEAGGPDRNPWLHIPIGYYRTIFDPKLGWGYQHPYGCASAGASCGRTFARSASIASTAPASAVRATPSSRAGV